MRLKQWVGTFLIITLAAMAASADEQNQITRKTFLAFAKVSGIDTQYARMATAISERVQQGILVKFQNRMNQENVPADVKEKLFPLVNESAKNIKTMFEAMFNEEITFDSLVTNVYLPIYRNHFSESEMQELITFYGSPIGKKVSTLVPVILRERSETFARVYNERIQAISKDIIEKEINRIRLKLKEMKPDNSNNPEHI